MAGTGRKEGWGPPIEAAERGNAQRPPASREIVERMVASLPGGDARSTFVTGRPFDAPGDMPVDALADGDKLLGARP